MNTKRALTSLVAAVAIGWLGGGTCQVSYCSEDCDPCLQQCVCQTHCHQTGAAFQAAHALVAFEVVDVSSEEGALQRNFTDIRGIRVQRAGGSTIPDVDDCVRCARGVLVVNARLFHRDASEFVLRQAERCASGTLLHFEREQDGRVTDLVTFFFDPLGNLMQIAHDAR
jgi:hypothetical protein